jgi:hypothetical protein
LGRDGSHPVASFCLGQELGIFGFAAMRGPGFSIGRAGIAALAGELRLDPRSQNPNRLSARGRGPRRFSTIRSPPLQAELP